MKKVIAFLCMVIGWLLAVTSTFVWIAHGIKHIFFMNEPFFHVVAYDTLFWFIQLAIGIILLIVPAAIIGQQRSKLYF